MKKILFSNFKTKLKSRRFWVFIVGSILLVLNQFDINLPVSDVELVYSFIAFLVSMGILVDEKQPCDKCEDVLEHLEEEIIKATTDEQGELEPTDEQKGN